MSTKYLVWGDLQAHAWQGLDSRRDDCARVITSIYDDAEKHKVDFVVFLGDLFEAKRSIRLDVLSSIYNTLGDRIDAANAVDICTIMLAGNHDFYRGFCTLAPFRHYGAVVVHNGAWLLPNEIHNIIFIPFSGASNSKKIPQSFDVTDYRIAFTHANIKGVSLTKNGITTQRGDLLDEFFEKRNSRELILNGHYHERRMLPEHEGRVKIFNVGAPISYSWSDIDAGPRGYVVVDDAEDDDTPIAIHLYELEDFPKFLSKQRNARKDLDFVRPEIASTLKEPTLLHDDSDEVSSEDKHTALSGYMKSKQVSVENSKRFMREGVRLLVGDDDE